jgi:hypothetical protein
MKNLFGKCNYSSFVVFCLVAIGAIVVCNLWSLYWGHCVLSDFLRIPPMGWGVIAANLIAALVYFMIKRHNVMKNDSVHCVSCRSELLNSWVYCPNCGNEHTG